MAKSMMGLWSRFLLTILLIVAASRGGAAGTIITVTFSGTASGSSTGTFSGAFAYDQSLPDSSPHTFNFAGSADTHTMVYNTVPTGRKTGSSHTCEPFTITTSNNTFILVATVPGSPSTTVTIVVPTTVAMSATSLPGCSVFPSTPTNSTFTLSGGFSYTGTITTLSCGGPLIRRLIAEPSPLCPPPDYVYTYAYPAPAPCPVYTCPPRPACCLTRLFARRSCRISCW